MFSRKVWIVYDSVCILKMCRDLRLRARRRSSSVFLSSLLLLKEGWVMMKLSRFEISMLFGWIVNDSVYI